MTFVVRRLGRSMVYCSIAPMGLKMIMRDQPLKRIQTGAIMIAISACMWLSADMIQLLVTKGHLLDSRRGITEIAWGVVGFVFALLAWKLRRPQTGTMN